MDNAMRKRKRANTSTVPGPDRISSLPDPILHHILSFLKVEEAVKTCVLSKRWEHLWPSMLSLHFDSDHFSHWEWFIKFVNSVMLRREPLDLDIFHLHCSNIEMDEEVGDWINYAVKHHTRVLHFSYDYSLPSCVYTCTTIEELYLYNCNMSISLNVNLPKLKKLVIHYSENAPSLKNLLSGCPIMEYLELHNYFVDEYYVMIAHEHLKHLRISDCSLDRLLIDAPNLLSFYYTEWNFAVELPSHEAELKMPSLRFASLQTSCFKMLGSFSNVEFLKIRFNRSELKESCGLQLPELPMFHRLKHVTVFYSFACFRMVAWILKSSPNLRKLTLFCCNKRKATTSTSEATDASFTVAITSCKKLEMIEVKYKTRSEMIDQLVDALANGAKELENLKVRFIPV